ncbi:MAG: GNAT family N-acetyltransferase, partial [Candidatus Sigynarchaeota archaeon]
MGRESKSGVYRLQQPGPEHIGAVRALATACNASDNLDLSLDWRQLRARPSGETSDFLFRLDGRWVGYLGLFQFSDQEVEIIGMVLPEYRRRGIFSELWRAAQSECAARGVKRALFICERRSESGRAFLRAIGARWDHAEYKMQLAQPWPAPQNPQRVRLRLATAGDRAEIARQNVIYFGNPGEQEDSIPESLRDDRHAVYIAEL